MRTASRYKAGPAEDGGERAQRDVLLSFVGTQATVQKSGMIFPQNLPERSWEQIGSNLRELVNSSAWWLADWLLYGEATYGWRRYKEAIERTGLDYQTLRNYAWVARRFERHRRRDSLSFAHHAEVTRLSPPEQDYWLRKAEQQKWSRNELRRALRAGLAVQSTPAESPSGDDDLPEAPRPTRNAAGGTGRQKVTTLTIELSAGQLEHYSKAAAARGLPLDQWVTQMIETADRRTADR
ncbi:LmbU family transcriptional regulator [Streptomyces sp. NPDC054766]|uniref:LmbU family transcriptional regulator n=1 Tax=Streptomyces rhizosphaerihabitans TaxID=1266770 RepID=UPI0021C15659|nr:LmbU family transcriptional regulator [Streptomyces rhizosphaerihabitans]MCT9008791.1 LmbU family transcriptional regulator [Streptomyces rhizosphaerihabitans]